LRIGITTYGRDSQGRLTLPAEYVTCVRAAGGRVVLLPPGEPDPAGWLDDLDGIVLAGGGDLAPETWGGTGTAENYGVDLERDRTELALAATVLDRHLPSLWICRGLQVLNVVLGGTLIEHLPDRVGEEVLHRLPPREPVSHRVELEPDSRLARSLGCARCDAVSWHHQAVDRPGSQLVVVARAPDGTIEALELPSHPELVAVQWHPELSAAEDPLQQGLFNDLVTRAQP
jgi:putative glutamine amidotransferase